MSQELLSTGALSPNYHQVTRMQPPYPKVQRRAGQRRSERLNMDSEQPGRDGVTSGAAESHVIKRTSLDPNSRTQPSS